MTRNTIQDNQGKERVESWLAQLSENGYRLTAPRKAVVDVVAKSGRALAPAQVYELARARYTRLGLVTVYRTLEKLEELGLVQRLHQPQGCQAFVAAVSGHQHLLVCQDCGQVVYFSGEGDRMEALMAEVGGESGYRVDEHWLQLFGLCGECRKNNFNYSSGTYLGK